MKGQQPPATHNSLSCLIAENEYGKYCVPHSSYHRPAAQKVLAGTVYEPDTIKFMRQHCQGGDVVHAGTYFGDFLPALADGCDQGRIVWAFEPNPENHQCASITLQLNEITNVQLTHAGLGAKAESLKIKTVDQYGQALGGASEIVESEKATANEKFDSVNIVTIDDVIGSERHVSIIQLDVEGHEKAALIGAMQTIQRCKPIIILEVLSRNDLFESQWFKDNFLALGYQHAGKIHGNDIYQCDN